MRIGLRGEKIYDEDARSRHIIFAEEVSDSMSNHFGRNLKESNADFWAFVSQHIVDEMVPLMERHERDFASNPDSDKDNEFNTLITKKRSSARLALKSATKAIDQTVDVSKADSKHFPSYEINRIRTKQFRATVRHYYFVANRLSDRRGKHLTTRLMDAIIADGRFVNKSSKF